MSVIVKNGGGENVTPEVTAQVPIIQGIADNFGVEITTPTGTNKQILQGNNANLQSIKTNAKKSGLYVWKKCTAEGRDFVDFVVSDDEASYPNGAIHTDGYFYIRISSTGQPIIFSYTGTSNFKTELDETVGGLTWELQLLTSGILTIDEVVTPINDIFLVGGGGGGSRGSLPSGSGGGGGGGYTFTQLDAQLPTGTDCEVIIGAGGARGAYRPATTDAGNGGNTSIMGFTANGGNGGTVSNGGNGGSGGGAGGRAYGGQIENDGTPGTGQGTTTRAFGEPTGTLYAGGGGGGSDHYYIVEHDYLLGGNGGSDGSNGFEESISSSDPNKGGTGGSGGGANGGPSGYAGASSPATANTGGGGGGGGSYCYGEHRGDNSNGSAGGSGIIILRGRYS